MLQHWVSFLAWKVTKSDFVNYKKVKISKYLLAVLWTMATTDVSRAASG